MAKRVNKLPLELNTNLTTSLKKKVGTPAKGESESKHTNPASSNDDTARRIAEAYAQSQTKQAQNRSAPKKNSNVQPASGNNIVPVKKAYKKEEDARKEIETSIANGTAKKLPSMKQDTAGLVRRSAAKTTAKATAKKDDATGKTTSSNAIDGPIAKTLRPHKTTTKKAEPKKTELRAKALKPVTTKGKTGSSNEQKKRAMVNKLNAQSAVLKKVNQSKDVPLDHKSNNKGTTSKSKKTTKTDNTKKNIKKGFDAVAAMKERRAKAMANRDKSKNPNNVNLRGIVKKGKGKR